jgi:hypothetical protein
MVRKKTRMVVLSAGVLGIITASLSENASAANINRRIVAELDPVAPSSALYEERSTGVSTSKFGGSVDFNVGHRFSMGPEVWSGTFLARGKSDTDTSIRREDLFPGERHKLDAMRLRWNVSFWEIPESMRGFYTRVSYDYIRVNSRANRYTESLDSANALPVDVSTDSPMNETDLITDVRHGMSLAIGNRWLISSQNLSFSVGAGVSHYFRRSVNVDSKDSQAVADYESLINTLPDTRLALRPIPELSMGLGYAF